jgi:hypothetical protein
MLIVMFQPWKPFFCGSGGRHGLIMCPRLVWNSRSSCLSLLSAEIAAMCHHAQLETFFIYQCLKK